MLIIAAKLNLIFGFNKFFGDFLYIWLNFFNYSSGSIIINMV